MASQGKGGNSPEGSSKSGFNPPQWFWDSRKKGPSPSGTVTFILLRALDLPLQWWLLRSGAASGLLARMGATPVAQPFSQSTTNILGLGAYHSLIFGLVVGSSAKQIYWKLLIGDTVMPTTFAAAIGAYNTVLNSLNTLLSLWVVTTQQPSDQSSWKASVGSAPVTLKIGIALYLTGLLTEWWCEVQRRQFKQNPANEGKPFSGGLFALARNINYGGYTLWRSGYSLGCGGWVWAAIMCSWLAGDFIRRAIPSMDAYCEKKYGEQWHEVQRKVPYKLLPWIY